MGRKNVKATVHGGPHDGASWTTLMTLPDGATHCEKIKEGWWHEYSYQAKKQRWQYVGIKTASFKGKIDIPE